MPPSKPCDHSPALPLPASRASAMPRSPFQDRDPPSVTSAASEARPNAGHAIMPCRDGDCQRVGGVGIVRLHAEKPRHHRRHLALVGGAGADNRFLDPARRQFAKRQAGGGALRHRDTARHAELQRRRRRTRDENLLDGDRLRPHVPRSPHRARRRSCGQTGAPSGDFGSGPVDAVRDMATAAARRQGRRRPSPCCGCLDRCRGSASAAVPSSGQPGQNLVRNVEIGRGHVLHVVIVVERVEKLQAASSPGPSPTGSMVFRGFQARPGCRGSPNRASSASTTLL